MIPPFTDFLKWLSLNAAGKHEYVTHTLGGRKTFSVNVDFNSGDLIFTDRDIAPMPLPAIWKVYVRFLWLFIADPNLLLKAKAYVSGKKHGNWTSGNPNSHAAPYIAALIRDWLFQPGILIKKRNGKPLPKRSAAKGKGFKVIQNKATTKTLLQGLHNIQSRSGMRPIVWKQNHLKALNKILQRNPPKHQSSVGVAPASFAKDVGQKVKSNKRVSLPDHRLNRDELLSLCSCDDLSLIDRFIAIMAWGGARRNNVESTLKNLKDLNNFLKEIKSAPRLDAYQLYKSNRTEGKLPGLGVSFATKVIFFMGQSKPKGYILDQWTLKSMSLLVENFPILITPQGLPDPMLTASDYVFYCECIEALATELKLSPDLTETILFSEGRKKGKWRQYVIANV